MTKEWMQGSLHMVEGAPEYKHAHTKELHELGADVFRRPYQPYGASPEEIKAVKAEIEKLKAGVRRPRGADIQVAIPGLEKMVDFTPQEVYRAAHDKNFARSILSSATGIPDITDIDLEGFQHQLQLNHPQIVRGNIPLHDYEALKEFEDRLKAERLEEYKGKIRSEADQRGIPPEALPAAPQIPDDQQLRGTLAQWGRSGWIGNDILPQYEQQKKEILEGKRDKFEITGLGRGGSDAAVFNDEMLPQLLNYRQRLSAHPAEVETAKQRYYDQALQPRLAEYHQREREIASDPELARQDKEAALRALEKSMMSRAGIERAEKEKLSKIGLLAPMNAYHEEANRLMRDSIGKEIPQLEGIERNIRRAEGIDIPGAVNPYMDEVRKHAHEFAGQYENPHQEAYIQSLRDRMLEDFEKKILPAVNARVPITDGARQAILNKYAENMQKELAHKALEMRERNYQQALQHAEHHQNKMLSGAQVAGNAQNLQHSHNLAQADALKNQALVGQQIRHHQVQGIGAMAHQKQQQAQNEIETLIKQQARAEEHPKQQLQSEASLANQLPAPTTFTSQLAQGPMPAPPNPLQWGAPGLAAAYKTLVPQQRPEGQGFAKGGQVSDYQSQIQDHDAEMRNMESRLKSTPNFNWGSQFIGNLAAGLASPNPLHGFGQAIQRTDEQGIAHLQHQHNLYDKIMQSRNEQKKVLMDYQARKESLDEQKRHHGMMEAAMKEKAANQPVKLTRADQNLITEANKEMDATNYIEDRLDELDAIIENVYTGHPSISSGLLKEPMWQAFYGMGKQADIEKINMLTNDIVNEGTKKFGRGAGIGMRNALATAKMGIQYRPETNKAAIARIRKDIGKLRNKYGHMFDALDNDNIPPSKSISHHYSKRVNKKDGEPKGNAFSPNREDENQFQDSDAMPSQDSEREALERRYAGLNAEIANERGS